MELSKKDQALFDAVNDGDIAKIKAALKGANVNAKSEWDGAPIHVAARKGNVEVIKLLLENKADIEAKDPVDMTPLMVAAVEGQVPAAMLLLEKGAKVTNDIIMTLSQKIKILEENAENGMVKPEAVKAWKAFLEKIVKSAK